jgi:hypothetical protein
MYYQRTKMKKGGMDRGICLDLLFRFSFSQHFCLRRNDDEISGGLVASVKNTTNSCALFLLLGAGFDLKIATPLSLIMD